MIPGCRSLLVPNSSSNADLPRIFRDFKLPLKIGNPRSKSSAAFRWSNKFFPRLLGEKTNRLVLLVSTQCFPSLTQMGRENDYPLVHCIHHFLDHSSQYCLVRPLGHPNLGLLGWGYLHFQWSSPVNWEDGSELCFFRFSVHTLHSIKCIRGLHRVFVR